MASTGAKIAVGTGISLTALLGLYFLTRTSTAVSIPSACNGVYVMVSGSSVVSTGQAAEFTVYVTADNAPLVGSTVNLTGIGNGSSGTTTSTTNDKGQAVFTVTFSEAGEYSLIASVIYNGASCSSVIFPVNVTQACPNGQINYNGSCQAATITLTASQTDFTTIPATVTFRTTILLTSGEAVSGKEVTLKEITTGSESSSTTNSSGEAEFDVTIDSYGTFVFEAEA